MTTSEVEETDFFDIFQEDAIDVDIRFRDALRARWKEIRYSISLLRKNTLFLIGFFTIFFLVLLAVFTPYLVRTFDLYHEGEQAHDIRESRIYNMLDPGSKDIRQYLRWGSYSEISEQLGAEIDDIRPRSVFTDINGDNLIDILTGTNDSRLLLFLNKGTAEEPLWEITPSTTYTLPDLSTIADLGTEWSPAIGDLDNNAAKDIMIGDNLGNLYVSTNLGTPADPVWSDLRRVVDERTDNLDDSYTRMVNPTLHDYDMDGDLDLIVGTEEIISNESVPKMYVYYNYQDLSSYREVISVTVPANQQSVNETSAAAFESYAIPTTLNISLSTPNNVTSTADVEVLIKGIDTYNEWQNSTYTIPQGQVYVTTDTVYQQLYEMEVDLTATEDSDIIVTVDSHAPQFKLRAEAPLDWQMRTIKPADLQGSGPVRVSFSYIDLDIELNRSDLILTFASGDIYFYSSFASIKAPQFVQLNQNATFPTFRFPKLVKGEFYEIFIGDLNNDYLPDIIVFSTNNELMFAAQYLEPDGRTHWMGTDFYGMDVLSQILWALRLDLLLAIWVVSWGVFIGVILGAIAGYYGGWVDQALMRITDVFFAFPGLILAMAISAALGKSMFNLSIALIVVWWSGYARLIRGQVIAEKNRLYVDAARSLGLSNPRIIFRHVLPNSIYPILVAATMDLGGVLLVAAGLSFIGFGASTGDAELGRLISDGRDYIELAPWIVFFPGIFIFLIVLAFNLIGDGLRDVLDPKLRR